jgi:tripartite-type tricarboxylate transporter receptor subunit TctC
VDKRDAPYKNTKEFIDAAKKADPSFKMGGTGSKREDHVAHRVHGEEDRRQVRVPAVQVGGEAATQLVGNHTASNVNNPSENLEVWRAGQCGRSALFEGAHPVQDESRRRHVVERHPDCPEQGLDVTYQMLRAFFLPGKVSPRRRRSTWTS